MDVYMYCAALYCFDCGIKLRAELDTAGKTPPEPIAESTYNSDDYPKGPYTDGGGEADSPQHCDACGRHLENPLTEDGAEFVRDAIADGEPDGIARTVWAPFYDVDIFDACAATWRPALIDLLTELQKGIADDYRATDDPEDDTPAMAITIATDDACSGWAYQTGDNSYTGGCYSFPYWGVGSITRDDNPADTADALLADLGETWAAGQS